MSSLEIILGMVCVNLVMTTYLYQSNHPVMMKALASSRKMYGKFGPLVEEAIMFTIALIIMSAFSYFAVFIYAIPTLFKLFGVVLVASQK